MKENFPAIPNNDIMCQFLKETNICLKNGCFLSVLTNVLVFPDICGKAEYPKENSSEKRYTNWLNKYVLNDPLSSILSAGQIYKLRCSLLHEGNPNLTDKKKYLF